MLTSKFNTNRFTPNQVCEAFCECVMHEVHCAFVTQTHQLFLGKMRWCIIFKLATEILSFRSCEPAVWAM